MAFPASPSNNQLVTVNNITYIYSSASNSWTRTAGANIVIGNGTVTSTSTTTGALIVQGGAGISGNLFVGSNASINGTTFNGTAPWATSGGTVTDAAIVMPFGQWGIYSNVSTNGLTYARAVLAKDSSNNIVIGSSLGTGMFANINVYPGSATSSGSFNIYNGSSTSVNLLNVSSSSNTITVSNTQNSTSSTTGALIVAGGVGISGALYVGGLGSFAGGVITGQVTSNNATPRLYNDIQTNIAIGGTTTTVNVLSTVTSTSSVTGALVVAGGVGIGGNTYHGGWIIPSANSSYNLGTTTAWWNTVYGKAVQAQYADLAENYTSDSDYAPGTVVVFGGEKEITISTQDHDSAVAGVISTDPAYLMNGTLENGLPVALTGRVPCQVQGPVNKGTVLVTSVTPGVARAIDNSKFVPGCVIGKALESINTNTIETIEVVVGKH